MAVELNTPSFKPREYEGEKIEYLVYGLDDEGNEIECIDGPADTPDSAAGLAGDILKQFPDIYFHVTAVLNDKNGKMKDSEVVWSNFPEKEEKGADEGPYTIYFLDEETGRVSKVGVYPTWRKAYAALDDGTVWDEGSSNNFVFHGNHLQQIYKYKKTGRTGKWSGNGYDVIFDREISEDPADYIKAHFTATRYNACRFNESKGADETIEYKKGHKNSRGEDAPWVILDHKNGKVLASFPEKDDAEAHLERMKHYSKGEKLFNKQELESMAMNGYKAAVTAAWSGAGVKNFKIDIRANEEEPPALDIYPKALDGKDIDVSWRLLPNVMKIVQYSISPAGNHTIERELDFATEDDVEIIFTDEFKSVDDVLEHGIGSYDSANELSENDIIKEQAMGIKLIKKESMERCDSCGAVMTEYEYDRYGGLCKHCRSKESKKSETAPDEYARNTFLKGALDYAEIEDDEGNVVLLKIAKRYGNEIGGDFALRSYDGETDKSLAMGGIRYVVYRYGELLDMDPAEAIIEIAKE